MIRLAADENFNNRILDGLRARNPHIDVIRIQDVGLRGADDPSVLEWAGRTRRILLTHDADTVTGYALDRVRAGLPMPGIVVVRADMPIGRAIEELVLLVECSLEGEWEGQVKYLPL